MNPAFIVVVLTLGLNGCLGAPKDDEVTDLPNLGFNLTFKHYSGYLNATDGQHLHYWFTESTNDPSNDPVVLWMNGGPGCSSLLALFTELGPFRLDDDGKTIVENPYSWNKIANIIFLEAPVCVGFSYDDSGECTATDNSTASSNYEAIKDFFTNKFPEYRENEFFIMGESYGGIYVPTLTVLVESGLKSFPLNLTGYAIGNGITSWNDSTNANIFYGYYHGLYGDELWGRLVEHCCEDEVASRETCNFYSPGELAFRCLSAVTEAETIIYGGYLNVYNIYKDCQHRSESYLKRYLADLKGLGKDHLFNQENFNDVQKTGVTPPCYDMSHLIKYLNSAELRDAAHIPKDVQDWDVCSNSLRYYTTYEGMEEQYKYLVTKVRGLLYTGDVDMACNFLGAEWFVEKLGFEVVKKRKVWYTSEEDKVVGGFVKRFKNLDLLTVLGSGHMAPEDKPAASFKLISSFIKNEPY